MSTRDVLEHVSLKHYTSLELGGDARYFVECASVTDLQLALEWARKKNLRVQILGGGSNIVFSDNGFDGLVIKINMRGISVHDDIVSTGAGEPWDSFVGRMIEYGLGGIECLSGIPGLVGGTPIQNVGAYGQEVCETIVSVEALDRERLETVTFTNEECLFSYRTSRFKTTDAGRFVITAVEFKLNKNGKPAIRYPDVEKYFTAQGVQPTLLNVREAIRSIRKKKSMVLDPADPYSRSAGSFFTNPVVSREVFAETQRKWESLEGTGSIPSYPSNDKVKIPAAWLVEHAGFVKGFRKGGIGISANHSLALVNYGGTSEELLSLAHNIQRSVQSKFGVRLEIEPVVVV